MPRYSIVITTVNRPEILRESLAATLALRRDDMEILVSDNFSDQSTQDVLDSFDDPRLRKFRTDYRMPMPDHWNWIWEKTTGDFVLYSGDDSTLTEEAFKAADHAIDKYDADIISWRLVQYYHPDWHVKFRHLPDRGNILGVNLGFSNGLFRVRTSGVIRHFCDTLRLSACFPSVIGFLVKREIGDKITKETGKFHWAPCPDISASLMALTRAGEGRFYYWDGVGGIGGWSGDSNIASALSGGRKSKRLKEFMNEFKSGDERFPNHDHNIETITNFLAAAVSQTKHNYSEEFLDYDFDVKTMVMRSIDDAYRDLTVPWVDDDLFISQLEDLIDAQEPADRDELRQYMTVAKQELQTLRESGEEHYNPTPTKNAGDFFELVKSIFKDPSGRDRRLLMKTHRNPVGKYWEYAGTTFIDLDLFGVSTIRDIRNVLPAILEEFRVEESQFLPQYRDLAILDEPLEILNI